MMNDEWIINIYKFIIHHSSFIISFAFYKTKIKLMQRTTLRIQKDMLKWAMDNLYTRASDEWAYEALEADPLVHLLVGACASEAQLVYNDLQETDDRILQRVLRYLLPEAFHLPIPAAAIATAHIKPNMKFGTAMLSEKQTLTFSDTDKTLHFSPLFETKLLNGSVRFLCTDEQVIDKTDPPKYHIKNAPERVSKLLVGIETSEKLPALEGMAFYVDFKGQELEKRQFLTALSKSEWSSAGQLLNRQNGFLAPDVEKWQERFEPELQMRNSLDAQFRLQFQYISSLKSTDSKPSPPAPPLEVMAVLKNWLLEHPTCTEEAAEAMASKRAGVKTNIIWLRIQLPYAILLTDVERYLNFDLNRFIVVNRRLVELEHYRNYITDNKFRQLEVIEIAPKQGLFQYIKSVYNKDNQQFLQSVAWSKLLEMKQPMTYTFRLGGVGRADSYNTWQRFSYMLSVFRKEHLQDEVKMRLEKRETYEDRLGDKVSLEELYEIVGKRVSKLESEKEKLNILPAYIFAKPSEKHILNLKIEYWTTDGAAANGLRPDSKLTPEPATQELMPFNIQLMTSPAGGKNTHSVAEQVQVAQDTLFRRDRIVSQEDIRSLCRRKMGAFLKNIAFEKLFETDPDPKNGGIRRAVQVRLKVENPKDAYIQQLGQEIEWELMEKSVGTMPYRVCIEQA